MQIWMRTYHQLSDNKQHKRCSQVAARDTQSLSWREDENQCFRRVTYPRNSSKHQSDACDNHDADEHETQLTSYWCDILQPNVLIRIYPRKNIYKQFADDVGIGCIG